MSALDRQREIVCIRQFFVSLTYRDERGSGSFLNTLYFNTKDLETLKILFDCILLAKMY